MSLPIPRSLEETDSMLSTVPVTTLTEASLRAFRLCESRCNSWLCSTCFRKLVQRERERWYPVVADFKDILMVTLTIDPALFHDAKEAFLYVKHKRCIPRLMTKLRRADKRNICLNSHRYIYRLEFQGNGMIHCHVVLDARFFEHAELERLWATFRPPEASGRGQRPDLFGYVWITKEQSKWTPATAVDYLLKTPEHPWPNFLMDMGGAGGRFRPIGESHKLCKPRRKPRRRKRNAPQRQRARMSQARTHRQRIGNCGNSTKLLSEEMKLDPETGELVKRVRWEATIPMPASVAGLNVGASKQLGAGYLVAAQSADVVIDQLGALLEDPTKIHRRTPAASTNLPTSQLASSVSNDFDDFPL